MNCNLNWKCATDPGRLFQRRRPFLPPLPTVKNDMHILLASPRPLKIFHNYFTPPLPAAVWSEKMMRVEFCFELVILWKFAISCTSWRVSFKGLSDLGGNDGFSWKSGLRCHAGPSYTIQRKPIDLYHFWCNPDTTFNAVSRSSQMV